MSLVINVIYLRFFFIKLKSPKNLDPALDQLAAIETNSRHGRGQGNSLGMKAGQRSSRPCTKLRPGLGSAQSTEPDPLAHTSTSGSVKAADPTVSPDHRL